MNNNSVVVFDRGIEAFPNAVLKDFKNVNNRPVFNRPKI